MTDEPQNPDADVVLVEFGKVQRANGWFVLERSPGRPGTIEYGPMPEEQILPFIQAMKATIMAMATDAVDRQTENLATLMSPGEGETKQ